MAKNKKTAKKKVGKKTAKVSNKKKQEDLKKLLLQQITDIEETLAQFGELPGGHKRSAKDKDKDHRKDTKDRAEKSDLDKILDDAINSRKIRFDKLGGEKIGGEKFQKEQKDMLETAGGFPVNPFDPRRNPGEAEHFINKELRPDMEEAAYVDENKKEESGEEKDLFERISLALHRALNFLDE